MSTWTEKDQRLFELMRDGGRRRPKSRDASRTDESSEAVGVPADQRPTDRPIARPRTIRSRRLEERTLDELYLRARELDIAGRSQMTRDELVAAIRAAN